MPLDPNWFYSTLAQSTAAIVGLAGGFLVQRILAQRSDIAQERRDLLTSAGGFLANAADAKKRADDIIPALTLALAEAEADKAPDPLLLSTDDVFSLTHGRGYTAGSADRYLPVISPEDAIPRLRDVLQAATEYRDAIPTTLGRLGPMLVRSSGLDAGRARWLEEPPDETPEERGGIDPRNFWDWLPRHRDVMRDSWRGLNGEPGSAASTQARGLAARLTVLRERLVPASFWWLWASLVGLLALGLIAPLTYLSARDGASKWWLLASFGVLSISFLGFIAFEMQRLRSAGDLARDSF